MLDNYQELTVLHCVVCSVLCDAVDRVPHCSESLPLTFRSGADFQIFVGVYMLRVFNILYMYWSNSIFPVFPELQHSTWQSPQIVIVCSYSCCCATAHLCCHDPFCQPTINERRVALKWKREETSYTKNVSIKYDHQTTALGVKHTLMDVLFHSGDLCMHNLTHLQAWLFFML